MFTVLCEEWGWPFGIVVWVFQPKRVKNFVQHHARGRYFLSLNQSKAEVVMGKVFVEPDVASAWLGVWWVCSCINTWKPFALFVGDFIESNSNRSNSIGVLYFFEFDVGVRAN